MLYEPDDPYICEHCGVSFYDLEFTYGPSEFCSKYCRDMYIEDCEWDKEE